jgi:Xaa-Pro dipeptidase
MTDLATTYATRRDRLRAVLPEHDVDALIVTNLSDARYLTGYSGSNAAVLIAGAASGDLLVTDFRYALQVVEECPGISTAIERTVDEHAAKAAAEGGWRIGLQGEVASVMTAARVEKAAGVIIKALGDVISPLREDKDDGERSAVARACALSDEGLAALLQEIKVGWTEREIARRLLMLMLEAGAEAESFEAIVATGPHSAIPHHQPTDRAIARGDLLKIDFGALFAGYHADETRTFMVAADPEPWQAEIHALVKASQQAGREAAVAGAELAVVDRASRVIIEEAGFGEFFGHGLGHGVGLDIHERPFLGQTAEGRLLLGSTVTVEPGIYLPDRGGVRIEDTCIVGAAGPAEPLTTTTRELLVVG